MARATSDEVPRQFIVTLGAGDYQLLNRGTGANKSLHI